MQLRTQIIRANQFVRTTPTGGLDLEQSKRMLREVLDTAREKLICELLLDLREAAEARLNDAEVHELAESLKDYPSLFWRKMALLLPPDAPGIKASRFQIRANSLGFDVQTFKEFEKAIYWLSTVQEVAAQDLA